MLGRRGAGRDNLCVGSGALSPSEFSPADRPGTHRGSAIAVVGLSCRLPSAPDPARFWELLRDGVSAVSEPPPGRRG
ncbi:beta-ketoacyl synthase N-terminal-like domain-containing protein, partial [Streptomyces sp. 2MCAF27]